MAPIHPLAQELPYATGVTRKKERKKERKKGREGRKEAG